MPHPREAEPRPPDGRLLLARYEQAWERYRQTPNRHHLNVLTAGERLLLAALAKPGKFPSGLVVATPGALAAMGDAGHIPPAFLLRHRHGDWGLLDAFDRQQNELALLSGSRLLSA